MSIIREVEKIIKNHIIKAGYEIENVTLETSSRPDLGEYQINSAFNLGKQNHCNPREVAEKIVAELSENKIFTNLNIAGAGFINISFSDEFYINSMNKLSESLNNNIDSYSNKKVFMDYGGANIAKTLHVGHLRSADMGEAVKRLAEVLGYQVISDVHFGDYVDKTLWKTKGLHAYITYQTPTWDYRNAYKPLRSLGKDEGS